MNKQTVNKLIDLIGRRYSGGNAIPVVAISGGVDSMVLAHLFRKAKDQYGGFSYHLFHFDHNQGRHDEECKNSFLSYVKDYNFLEIEYSLVIADTESLRLKEGFEQTARKARYAAFLEVSKKVHENYNSPNTKAIVVTGHHANDQVENILMGICRGIPMNRVAMARVTSFINSNVEIHRPLLDLTKKDIHSIANSFGLSWAEDETNCDQKYERNFFRHSVIPLLGTRRNVLKTIRSSVITPEYIEVNHKKNLFSQEHNHFL